MTIDFENLPEYKRDLLSGFFRYIVLHFYWLRNRPIDPIHPADSDVAQRIVADEWGIPRAMILEIMLKTMTNVQEVTPFTVDSDQLAVESNFQLMASAFKKIAE